MRYYENIIYLEERKFCLRSWCNKQSPMPILIKHKNKFSDGKVVQLKPCNRKTFTDLQRYHTLFVTLWPFYLNWGQSFYYNIIFVKFLSPGNLTYLKEVNLIEKNLSSL